MPTGFPGSAIGTNWSVRPRTGVLDVPDHVRHQGGQGVCRSQGKEVSTSSPRLRPRAFPTTASPSSSKVLQRTFDRDKKLDSASIHKTMVDEVYTGKLSFTEADGVIMMKEYKFTPETNPDPVLGPDHYFFPVTQYMGGKVISIYPEAMATGKFVAPE